MEKERIKKFIGYAIIIILGVSCIWLICLRAEQVDRQVQYEESY